MSASTNTRLSSFASSRPSWAIQRSNERRAQQNLAPIQPDPIHTQPNRPSSRLSDHLTRDEEEQQAIRNDRAQQRALPVSRRSSSSSRGASRSVSTAVIVQTWDDETPSGNLVNHRPDLSRPGTLYPRFEPSRVHEELMKRESVREPVFGGRSKNQQLGSVAESWAAAPTIDIPKGMFELEDDPPSPIEGHNMTAEEIKAERARRAALGIPAEKSGRPSIKDMEKDKMDKLKFQQLKEERARNEVDLKELRVAMVAVEDEVTTSDAQAGSKSSIQRRHESDHCAPSACSSDGW